MKLRRSTNIDDADKPQDTNMTPPKLSEEVMKVDAFPCKSHHLVEYCHQKSPSIACWTENGDAFIVKDQHNFALLLPQYFKHSNFQSFIRQLNLYGFSSTRIRLDAIPNANIKATKSSTAQLHHVMFRHENFHRGRKDLLFKIKRPKKPKRANSKKKKKLEPKEVKSEKGGENSKKNTNVSSSDDDSQAPNTATTANPSSFSSSSTKVTSPNGVNFDVEFLGKQVVLINTKLDRLISMLNFNVGLCDVVEPTTSIMMDPAKEQQQPSPSPPPPSSAPLSDNHEASNNSKRRKRQDFQHSEEEEEGGVAGDWTALQQQQTNLASVTQPSMTAVANPTVSSSQIPLIMKAPQQNTMPITALGDEDIHQNMDIDEEEKQAFQEQKWSEEDEAFITCNVIYNNDGLNRKVSNTSSKATATNTQQQTNNNNTAAPPTVNGDDNTTNHRPSPNDEKADSFRNFIGNILKNDVDVDVDGTKQTPEDLAGYPSINSANQLRAHSLNSIPPAPDHDADDKKLPSTPTTREFDFGLKDDASSFMDSVDGLSHMTGSSSFLINSDDTINNLPSTPTTNNNDNNDANRYVNRIDDDPPEKQPIPFTSRMVTGGNRVAKETPETPPAPTRQMSSSSSSSSHQQQQQQTQQQPPSQPAEDVRPSSENVFDENNTLPPVITHATRVVDDHIMHDDTGVGIGNEQQIRQAMDEEDQWRQNDNASFDDGVLSNYDIVEDKPLTLKDKMLYCVRRPLSVCFISFFLIIATVGSFVWEDYHDDQQMAYVVKTIEEGKFCEGMYEDLLLLAQQHKNETLNFLTNRLDDDNNMTMFLDDERFHCSCSHVGLGHF